MKKTYLFAGVILSLGATTFLFAADATPVTLALSPESHIYLSGTSTLHPYASTSTLTQIVAVLTSGTTTPAVFTDMARRAPFQKFEVDIPVKGLKSGESGLDKNLYKALKMGDVPDILFTLAHYESSPAAAEGSFPFKASGQLSIAGVQKDVVITGTARPSPDELVIDGQYDLKMSDYGIKPPTLLLGAIKVADPVVIHFHLTFVIQKGGAQ